MKRVLLFTGLCLLPAAAVYFAFAPTSTRVREPEDARTVSLGLALQPPSALLVVAHKEGFLREAGLKASVKPYASGARALDALAAGEVDVASVADVPVALAAITRRDFVIVATIGSTDNEPRIVVRTDRGIKRPSDLIGRRIGTQKSSAVHFFLHMFLVKHGIPESEVSITFLKAEELAPALIRGEVDAISMREPYVGQARATLGDRAAVFSEPGLYLRSEQLVASRQFVRDRPRDVERILRALVRAERFVERDTGRTIRILSDVLKCDEAELRQLWPSLSLSVRLNQSLVIALEEEARWAIGSGLLPRGSMPNFLEFLDLEGLKRVKPQAVTVIH